MTVFFLYFLVAVFLILGVLVLIEGESIIATVILALAVISGISAYSLSNNDEYNAKLKTDEAARVEQEKLDNIPILISTVDNCKVYEFKAHGYYKHFTVCNGQSIPTKTLNCGKQCNSDQDVK